MGISFFLTIQIYGLWVGMYVQKESLEMSFVSGYIFRS